MDPSSLLASTTALIQRDFALRRADDQLTLTESEVLRLLADEVDRYMESHMERLLSLLYTMDVAEEDVSKALHPLATLPANEALAKLIYERQKRRAYTKATFKPKPLEDEDLAW